ncbi:MAG: FxLYD domain-containing protein [Verrucomicrobiota bacterium]
MGCLALLAAMAFGIFAARKNAQPAPPEKIITETKGEDTALQIKPVERSSARRAKKLAAAPDFETNSLQALRVTLEKSEKSRLIYAIGAIRNQSNRQRFGVKVELDLLDEQGMKLGSATDYVSVIEPRKEWKFRAMVTEPKAASVKVTAIMEE